MTSHKPVGIPRVVDKIVWVNVIDQDGMRHTVAGYEGESLLLTLEKFRIEISASCRGGDMHVPETEDPVDPLRYGPTCSECQIEVAEPWINYIKPMGVWEKDRITKSITGFFTKSTRLACCFVLQKWMNGIEVIIPLNMELKMEADDDIAFARGENKVFRG